VDRDREGRRELGGSRDGAGRELGGSREGARQRGEKQRETDRQRERERARETEENKSAVVERDLVNYAYANDSNTHTHPFSVPSSSDLPMGFFTESGSPR